MPSKVVDYCKSGRHKMTPANVYVNNAGKRQCKRCRYETQSVYRRKRLAEMRADRDHPYHGTTHGYSVGCRCFRCAVARSQYMRAWRIKHGLRVLEPAQREG